MFVVDPRRTETARVAGEHVFIRPGTDVFFYLSFLHELLHRGGVDRERVDAHMTGFEEVSRLAEAFLAVMWYWFLVSFSVATVNSCLSPAMPAKLKVDTTLS